MDADLGFDVSVKLRLRFAGINTPESRTRNKAEKALGLAAKARLKEILESADSVEFESHGKGKFGRVLATPYVVLSGKRSDVCQMLVREDHGSPRKLANTNVPDYATAASENRGRKEKKWH